MFNEREREYLGNATFTLQIIIAALACGVVIFAGVVLLLSQSDPPDQASQPIITYVALAFGMVALLVSAVVPKVIDAVNRKNFLAGNLPRSNTSPPPDDVGELGPLLGMYQTRLIVGAAILEGAAFFNIVANMIEGQSISLIIAALLLLGVMFKFPTRSSVENWVESERKTLEELRSLQN